VVLLIVGGYMWYKNRKNNQIPEQQNQQNVQNVQNVQMGGSMNGQTSGQLPPITNNPIQNIQLTQQMSQQMNQLSPGMGEF
jgi:hypothetical protein